MPVTWLLKYSLLAVASRSNNDVSLVANPYLKVIGECKQPCLSDVTKYLLRRLIVNVICK